MRATFCAPCDLRELCNFNQNISHHFIYSLSCPSLYVHVPSIAFRTYASARSCTDRSHRSFVLNDVESNGWHNRWVRERADCRRTPHRIQIYICFSNRPDVNNFISVLSLLRSARCFTRHRRVVRILRNILQNEEIQELDYILLCKWIDLLNGWFRIAEPELPFHHSMGKKQRKQKEIFANRFLGVRLSRNRMFAILARII